MNFTVAVQNVDSDIWDSTFKNTATPHTTPTPPHMRNLEKGKQGVQFMEWY